MIFRFKFMKNLHYSEHQNFHIFFIIRTREALSGVIKKDN